jgi:hypothetical protein
MMSAMVAEEIAVAEPASDIIDRWGLSGYLTAEQSEVLAAFLAQGAPKDFNEVKFGAEGMESVALRFLRARQFQLDKALAMLGEAAKMKRDEQAARYGEMSPDDCADCDAEVFKNFYPHATGTGFDKMNRPILFEHSGAIDPHVVGGITQTSSLVKYHWWTCEHELNLAFKRAAERGPLLVSTFVILDMSGLGMAHVSQHLLNHLKNLVSIDNLCYPELLGKMLIINAPWLAVQTWGMIKGWLDQRSQNKIEFVKQGETTKRLLDFVPAESLPVSYGGTGPPFYTPKPNTDFVTVGRAGSVTRSVHMGPNERLLVDSYIADADMRVEMVAHPIEPTATATSSCSLA